MSTLLDQQTEVHVQLGNGAPAFLPTAIGQHYIDIANRRVYQSVGINSVEDWSVPLANMADLDALPKTKVDFGLGNVEDYGVASQSEAELGQANDRYMTPLRVTQLLNALFMPVLDTFMARRDNPHQVTAEQVGALTSEATQLLLDEKLAEGDLAGLLQAFWAEKVGSAPETLDTIQEISAALQNNPDVITVLQQLVNDNAAAIGALETRVDGIDAEITQTQADFAAGVQAVNDRVDAEALARNTADQALDDKIVEVDTRLSAGKVDVGGDISTNTVTQGEGEAAQQVALSVLIAQLQAGISEAGDASDLEALQAAFNAFVAAKATAAEVIAGLDDEKYTTAMAVKGAIDQAVAELVGTAPEALDTIQELAEALQNNPDVIAGLVDQIATKETPEGAQAKADAALVEAKAYADTTAASSVEAAQLYSDSTTQALIDELNRLAAEIEGSGTEEVQAQ
jgi:hypothetical protein